jgi:hypothetical protein
MVTGHMGWQIDLFSTVYPHVGFRIAKAYVLLVKELLVIVAAFLEMGTFLSDKVLIYTKVG